MPDNFETYANEYADAAGLKPTDMPSSHHPLLESNDEVRSLSDLIDVRAHSAPAMDNADLVDGVDDPDLDIEEALTFPHKKRETTSADQTPALTDFDADARTSTAPEDADDASYMTRADFEEEMDATDPDPDAGNDASDYIGDSGLGRSPDITGTVTGIARGMATHLPQDLGADGFQIEDPENLDRSLVDEDEAAAIDATDPDAEGASGDRIPTAAPKINDHDDALDATRQIR